MAGGPDNYPEGAPPKLLLLGWVLSFLFNVTCKRDLRPCGNLRGAVSVECEGEVVVSPQGRTQRAGPESSLAIKLSAPIYGSTISRLRSIGLKEDKPDKRDNQDNHDNHTC